MKPNIFDWTPEGVPKSSLCRRGVYVRRKEERKGKGSLKRWNHRETETDRTGILLSALRMIIFWCILVRGAGCVDVVVTSSIDGDVAVMPKGKESTGFLPPSKPSERRCENYTTGFVAHVVVKGIGDANGNDSNNLLRSAGAESNEVVGCVLNGRLVRCSRRRESP